MISKLHIECSYIYLRKTIACDHGVVCSLSAIITVANNFDATRTSSDTLVRDFAITVFVHCDWLKLLSHQLAAHRKISIAAKITCHTHIIPSSAEHEERIWWGPHSPTTTAAVARITSVRRILPASRWWRILETVQIPSNECVFNDV